MANSSDILATSQTLPLAGGAESAPAAEREECFLSYNRHRRARLEAQVPERAREAVSLLPFLLHLNQPGLPGFVNDPLCPVGIADYSPSHGDLSLARRLFPGAEPRRLGILRPIVELVAAMGSGGTIGFSGESDLDIWVCYAPRHAPARARQLYEQKVRAVESWMNEHAGLEVHLFLQDADRVRENDFGQADLEGCGSAMGALLKEEFYRTSILLAGRIPAWWLVPPSASPREYQRVADHLRQDAGHGVGAYVDLGPVAEVPVGELFGAAIWQIVKSWKSPFKSALKMGLLEKEVRSSGQVQPLCEVLKERVLRGERPDPYRLLFDQVLSHYRAENDAETEDLLSRCFYLKTGVKLDPDTLGRRGTCGSDAAVLTDYVTAWGWGARRVRHLNNFAAWKFEWVQGLAKEIDRFFLRTYQRIREALDESGEAQRITDRDLTILGRKLQAAYRRVPDKVETLHLMGGSVREASLTLHQEALPNGEAPWSLYRGVVNASNAEERRSDLLRTSSDPLELLVWAARNRLLSPWTRLGCKGPERDISSADLEAVGQLLSDFVVAASDDRESLGALLEKPVRVRLLVVPNFGREDEEIVEIGAVWTTSWGETFYRRWEGADAFRGFAEDLFLPFLRESAAPGKVQVSVSSRKVGGARGAQWRLQRELPALGEYLGSRQAADDVRRRHVGPSGGGYFVLDRLGPEIAYKAFRERESLLRYLSGVGPYRLVETRVESHPGDLAMLKAVFDASSPGLVDVFTLRESDRETLFVVDEAGNFIHFPHPPEGSPYALAKLLVFLEQTLPDVASQRGTPLAGRTLDDSVRVHSLVREGTWRAFTSTYEHISRARALGLNPKGLTIERTSGKGVGGYVIQWGDETIRSGEVPNPVEEARSRILQSRASGLDYGVFITRLFLDERFVADCCGPFVATGHYLFYKKAVEQRLAV